MKKVSRKKSVPLEEVLKALGDPVRLSVVEQLLSCKEEKACGTFDYSVTKATFSHHIKILIDAGILQRREEGTRKFLSISENFLQDYPGLIKVIQPSR